ncbi:MAG: fluoride efflux transporter CrcB [Verrucomicrobiaceae bacterium]|nr:fluoride efflux transporter CrcB [Verrucomicrobiaceae bacterium]
MQATTATILVGLGGFAGAIARWGLSAAIKSTLDAPAFPYPTLIINLLGCLTIGVAYSLLEHNEALKLLIVVGFLGGFTTFSTFGLEIFSLIRLQSVATAALYAGLSTVLGVLLVWAGYRLTS